MELICKVKEFKGILRKIKLEGKSSEDTTVSLVHGCVLKAKDGKITCNVFDSSKVVFGMFEFLGLNIVEEGNIPIGDIDQVLDYMGRFKDEDEINISIKENKFQVQRESPKKTALIPLTEEQHIEDANTGEEILSKLVVEEDKVIFGKAILTTKIVTNVEDVKEFIDDGNVKGIKRVYPFDVKEGIVNCRVGNRLEGQIKSTLRTKEVIGESKSTFMNGIDNVFNNLEGEVKLFMSNDSPLFVSINSENFKAKFIIASISYED